MSFVKALIWLGFSTFFGLAQIFIVLVIAKMSNDYNFDTKKVFYDGTLLFFCSALVSAITIDFWFHKDIKIERPFEGLLTFFSIILIGVIVIVYCTLILKAPESINYLFVRTLEIIIICSSLAYTAISKTLQFAYER